MEIAPEVYGGDKDTSGVFFLFFHYLVSSHLTSPPRARANLLIACNMVMTPPSPVPGLSVSL